MENIRETSAALIRAQGAGQLPGTNRQGGAHRPAGGAAPPAGEPITAQSLLSGFEHAWRDAQREAERRIKALSSETRPLLEAQVLVNKLGMGTQLMAQTAEAVSSTVRRVQQLAGG